MHNGCQVSKLGGECHPLSKNPPHAFLFAGPASKNAFVKFVGEISRLLPATEGGSRFARLFDISKKSKLHDYFLLAGPLGAYLLHLAKGDIGDNERKAMTQTLLVCGELWEKVVFM